MYHLRVPVFLLAALVLLRCIAATPSHRYFGPGSSDDEQENALPHKESRSLPELIYDPFFGLRVARPERQVSPSLPYIRPVPKNTCFTSTCTTQKVAEFLYYHGGKVTHPVDVGPDSFGKRDTHQPPAQ